MRIRRRTKRAALAMASATALVVLAPTAAHAYYETPVCVSIEPFRVLDDFTAADHLARMKEDVRSLGVTADVSDLTSAYEVRVQGSHPVVVVAPTDQPLVLCPVIGDVVDTSTITSALESVPQPTADLPKAEYEVVGIGYEQIADLSNFGITPTALPSTPYVRASDQEQNERAPDSGNWRRNNSNCFWVEFKDDSVSRLVCWHLDQQLEDDGSRRFYQFHLGATGSGHGQQTIERMWVEAKPYDHAVPFAWDALPKPDSDSPGSGGCVTQGVSLSVASGVPVQVGFGYTTERTTCEDYLVKSYPGEHGHWASIWEGNPSTTGSRSVGLNLPVRAAQGDSRRAEWMLLTGQRWA